MTANEPTPRTATRLGVPVETWDKLSVALGWNPGDRVSVELAPGAIYDGTLTRMDGTGADTDPVWIVTLDEDGDDYAVVQSNLRRRSVMA